MSRIINTESVGKERDHLSKAIVAAIRALSLQSEICPEVKDLVSFIIISLRIISASIETSVIAWEKRDYWVKADRFRNTWSWTGKISEKLEIAFFADDWESIAKLVAEIGQKLTRVKVSDKNHLGTPWKGCWGELQKQHDNGIIND